MIIDLQNVKKRYIIGDTDFYALCGVSLKVERGEMLAIVGKSGSGKSTLMNILGCLDTPCEGRYLLCGYDVSTLNGKRLSYLRNNVLGFIFQGFNLIPTLNALENTELPLLYRGIPQSKRRLLAQQALCAVGLEDKLLNRPSQLSGGQQQRVAIARAIAAEPSVILADEPTGNLDEQSSKAVMRLLTSLHKSGKTVIIITHDMGVAAMAQRQITISDGRLV